MAVRTVPSVILRLNNKDYSNTKKMQEKLIELGYSVGIDGADGEFGPNTLAAVIKFQTEHSLDPDGEFGPQSWTALYEALGDTVTNPSYPKTTVVVVDNDKVQTKDFSVGDIVKLKTGATYVDGKKIPQWLFSKSLYVRNINSSASITISTMKVGLVTGNVHPKYLILVQEAQENKHDDTTTDVTPTPTPVNPVATSITPENLVKIAEAEIGYREKNSNSNLDDPTANAGGNNWTKYARDLANAGYYNGNKNGYAWCDVFADWCYWVLCGRDREKAERLICQSGDLGAACTYSADYYKNANQWSTRPQVGAQIFFYYSGGINHTGIVTGVTENQVITVEGNSSDQVARRTYPINYSSIAGYGIPRWNNTVQRAEMSQRIRVTARCLNIRADSNKKSDVIGQVYQNEVLKISKIEGTYGKLADQAGWVDLTYTIDV